ncbi:hypothetical protein EBB07_29265 [Paenibacillaceae bacterium]|nr:hypothetical protein EBB07_29265 [Paenibacillaceae bacterium]
MRSAQAAMQEQDLLHFAKITDIQKLKEVLELNLSINYERIQKLAFSESPEDNYERQRLIGGSKFITNLLSRI